ncbi:MAG: hypothetical protein ACM3PA_01395 [Methanomassiliicoccales archaeon]
MTDNQVPQMTPEQIAALQARVAKLQRILKMVSWVQYIFGVVLVLAPWWLEMTGLSPAQPYAYQVLAFFFVGLGYAANFAASDLGSARVVLRATAISQLGLAIVTLIGIFLYPLPMAFWGLFVVGLICGAPPAYVIYQFKKSS